MGIILPTFPIIIPISSMQKVGFGFNGAHFPNFAAEMAKFWEMDPVEAKIPFLHTTSITHHEGLNLMDEKWTPINPQ